MLIKINLSYKHNQLSQHILNVADLLYILFKQIIWVNVVLKGVHVNYHTSFVVH